MKTVKQISLVLKNEPGKLSAISELLGENGINILAFYIGKNMMKLSGNL